MARSFPGLLDPATKALFAGNPNIAQVPGFPPGAANTANASQIPADWAFGNGAETRWMNAAGTDRVRGVSVNAGNQLMVGEALDLRTLKTETFQVIDNASLVSQGFFTCPAGEHYRVVGISWIHATQASVAATAYVEKAGAGIAVGSGTKLNTAFDVHAIANNTTTYATLLMPNTGDSDDPNLQVNPGDQLNVVISATPTSLAGVSCTVWLAPLSTGISVKHANYFMNANADMVQGQYFFTASRPYIVNGVSVRFGTKSSVSGLKLTVTKDTSTNAPGAGTSVLSDNSNAGVLVTGTANTTINGTLTATAATLRLATGDRLSIEFSGATLTALAGLVVTVSLQETASTRVEKTFYLDHVVGNADLTGIAAAAIWTADRDYQIVDAVEVHKTAGNNASAVTIGVAIASGTTAPGSATIIQTDTSNAGFSIKSTAATPLYATLVALHGTNGTTGLFLMKGDRLCIVPAGTFTTAVGVQITVGLQPC